jgi:hypothetical protein
MYDIAKLFIKYIEMIDTKRFLVTMQFNEEVFLPIFLKHYSQYFLPENIYIIDHGSQKNIIPSNFNRIFIPRDKDFSEKDRLSLVQNLCNGLLNYYDYGVYADCDELICLENVDGKIFQLASEIYVAGFECSYITLDGRSYLIGIHSPDECKPLIFNKTPSWILGFHSSLNQDPPSQIDIPMAHIKFLDQQEATRRAEIREGLHPSIVEIERNSGVAGHWRNGLDENNNFYKQISLAKTGVQALEKFSPINRDDFFTKDMLLRSTLYVQPKYRFTRKGSYRDFSTLIDLSEHFPSLMAATL